MRSLHSDRRSTSAFTIIELVVVLLVIAIVSTASIHAWFGRSEVTLKNAAELMASDLRDMQTRAMIQSSPVEVVFDPDGGGYHARDLGRPDENLGARRYPQDAVFEDVRIAEVRVATGGSIVFDAIGRPSSDASVTLESRGTRTTVFVDAGTVRITVESGRSGAAR